MQDLYITYNNYSNEKNRESAISKLIKDSKVNCLFIDLTQEELDKIMTNKDNEKTLNPDNNLYQKYQSSSNNFPKSGKNLIDKMMKDEDIQYGFSRGLVYFEKGKENEDVANKIEGQYGMKCILGGKGIEPLKKGKSYYFEEGEDSSWGQIISTGPVPKMPCNAIIINDHYIHKQNGNANLCSIIKELSKGCPSKITFHILIIYSIYTENKNKLYEDARKTVESLINAVKGYSRCIIEFLYCDRTNEKYKLYQYTHDRFVISNYSAIDASHSLTLFVDNKVETEQKVTIGNLLYEATLKMNDTLIMHIANEIKKVNDNLKNPNNNNPYVYIRYIISLNSNGTSEVSLDDNIGSCKIDIQNRLILDEWKTK